jgi:hypothetical protein
MRFTFNLHPIAKNISNDITYVILMLIQTFQKD